MSSKIHFNDIIRKAPGKFHGGIHPPENKTLSNQNAIGRVPAPKTLTLPIKQNAGQRGKEVVKIGQSVVKGQVLVELDGPLSARVHAPMNASVIAIKPLPTGHPSGMPTPAIVLEQNGNPELTENNYSTGSLNTETLTTKLEPIEWLSVSDLTGLQARISQAGIVGLGGATFPTHIKTTAPQIEQLIINAMECEPYITCDDRMLKDLPNEVIEGAQIVAKLTGAKNIIFATEDNKLDSIESLESAIREAQFPVPMSIVVAPTKYPSGGEKQTIELVTGQQVPSGAMPASLGLLVQNVATVHAVYRAVVKGIPLIERVVTVTGSLVNNAGNYWIPLGTPISHIVEFFDIDINQVEQVVMGGPLMGQSITDLNAPITKATNCLIFEPPQAQDKNWLLKATEHQPCIRCSECEKACPAHLMPQQLLWFSQSDQWDKLQEQGLFDCIECGACAYVCPSEIPLVQYYRYGKSAIRKNQQKAAQADRAKSRFDFREMRLKREKAERALKHQRAAEARKQAAEKKNAPIAEQKDDKKAVINAALERVKQKKANQKAEQNSDEVKP